MSNLHIQQDAGAASALQQVGSKFSVELAPGKTLAVSLPGRSGTATSLTAAGRRTLASPHVTDVAAAVGGGAQFFTVINDSSAPTDYAYDASLTGGSTLKVSPSGEAALISADNQLGVSVAPAWAVDAAGKRVPTHYVARDGKLVQVVDHRGGNFTYPIVADPKWNTRWFGGEVIFNRHETAAIAIGGGAAAGSILGGCSFIPVPQAKLICAGVGAAVGLAASYFAAMQASDHCAKFYVFFVPPSYVPAPKGQKRGDIGCS